MTCFSGDDGLFVAVFCLIVTNLCWFCFANNAMYRSDMNVLKCEDCGGAHQDHEVCENGQLLCSILRYPQWWEMSWLYSRLNTGFLCKSKSPRKPGLFLRYVHQFVIPRCSPSQHSCYKFRRINIGFLLDVSHIGSCIVDYSDWNPNASARGAHFCRLFERQFNRKPICVFKGVLAKDPQVNNVDCQDNFVDSRVHYPLSAGVNIYVRFPSGYLSMRRVTMLKTLVFWKGVLM